MQEPFIAIHLVHPLSKLSPVGQQIVQNLSQRYQVSPDAVEHMLIAVNNGNGTMAQFCHPEFGGSGQWMSGGMTMVSDLFNHQLKSLVDGLCNDISNELAQHQSGGVIGSFQSQSQSGSHHQAQASGGVGGTNGLFEVDPEQTWWPEGLGTPSAVGSQNQTRYAYFANERRLAVVTGGDVWVYDTGDHQIGGFSQQQGGGDSITFTSQFGAVPLSTLPVVMRNGQVPIDPPPAVGAASTPIESNPPAAPVEPRGEPTPADFDAILTTVERLGTLHEKGFLSDEEFHTKKAELLSRL